MACGTSDIVDLIGVPFAWGGRGPDFYDCYGLLRELYRRDGFEVPDFLTFKDQEQMLALFKSNLAIWKPCDLKPGAALEIRVPNNVHCGYYLGNDQFVHTWEASGGVVIERLTLWKRRLKGVYEYVGSDK